MSNDLGSVPMQAGIILLLIATHGLFVLINTALGASGRNKEKLASANKLIILLCAVFGGWLAFTGIWEIAVYLVLMVSVGQYFPRKIALQHAEAIAENTLAFDNAAATVLRPLTWILMFIADILLKIFRQKTNVEDGEFSEEEVMSMLEVGQETGVIKEEGKKMINSIFAFDDKLAYEIMTPRTDVFLIDIEDPTEEYLDDLMTLRYSRIPVCEGETDNIIGILNIKDYLIKAREDGFDAVDMHKLGNLALLSKSDNSSLSNKPFYQKREQVNDWLQDFSKNIPISTRRAFLKMYSPQEYALDFTRWRKSDFNDMFNRQKKMLKNFIQGC